MSTSNEPQPQYPGPYGGPAMQPTSQPQAPLPSPIAPASAGGPFDPEGVVWTPVSIALARVRRAMATIFLVPVAIAFVVVGVMTGELIWHVAAGATLAVSIWAFWLIGRQVRAMGYAERTDDLLIRRGIMFKSMVVVPYGRMQYVDVSVGPIARYYKISSVQLHTASPGTDAAIHGLPPDEAARLRDRLAARGEARLAGL